MQNQGDSVVVCTRAVGVDLVYAAAGERGQLLYDRAVDENPQAAARYCAMLKRATINHNLARLIGRTLERRSQWHLIAGPGHVEMRHILDAEGDSDEYVRTLEPDAIHCVVYGLCEEVCLACRVWWVGAMRGERVRQGQRSAKATAVTVTTPSGHVSTVAGHGAFSCRALPGAAGRRAIQVPRSNQPAEYRQAGEVTPMFSSWMPESGHLDIDLRLPRFHGGPRPTGKPSRAALLRPLPVACAEPFGAARLGSDQTRGRSGAEAEHRRPAGSRGRST